MTTDILNKEIYPALYASADRIFPEFGFKKTSKGWRSTTKLKIDGTAGDSVGKVYIYANNPKIIKDWTRDAIAIWDYIKQRKNLSSNGEVFKTLAKMANIELPPLPTQSADGNKKPFIRQQLLKAAWKWMCQALLKDNEAKPIIEYLTTERRYSLEEIQKMKLGFLSHREKLRRYLNLVFQQKEVDFFLQSFHPLIGNSHRLMIPYSTHNGRLLGFAARTTQAGKEPKYLYSTGLKRSNNLYSPHPLKTNAHIIIVEGLLDSLILNIRGIDNVISLGGISLSREQIHILQQRKPRSITLALDNDETGWFATKKAIALTIAQSPEIPLYVLKIPSPFKDPDEWIASRDVDEFINAWHQTASAGVFLAEDIFKQHQPRFETQGMTARSRDALLAECLQILNQLHHPGAQHDFREHIAEQCQPYGIKPELLRQL